MSTAFQTVVGKCAVKINDAEIDFTDVEIALGTEQDNGSATVTCPTLPANADPNKDIDIYYDGTRIFFGQLPGPSTRNLDRSTTYTVAGRDALTKLRYKWGGVDRIYNPASLNNEDQQFVQNGCEAMGIDPSLTHIETSGWFFALLEDVVIRQGDSFLPIIREFDRLRGMATYTRGNGAVYRTIVAYDTPAATYTEGLGGIIRGNIQPGTIEQIINQCHVIGYTYGGVPFEGSYQASNADVPDPPQYFGTEITSRYLESDADCLDVATRIVTMNNFIPEVVTIDVPLDIVVQPGLTIMITSSKLGLSSANRFVTGVRHRITSKSAITTITAKKLAA